MVRTAVHAALIACGALALAPSPITPPSALVATVPAGRQAVGFHAEGDGANAMYFWYPARTGGGLSMGDYLGAERSDLAGALTSAGGTTEEVAAFTSAATLAAK